jgi:hypothetical protein
MKKSWWIIGLALALFVALLAPLASPHPDGLERVAEDQGFIDRAQEPWYELIPDYVFPGIESEAVATVVAGVVGVLLLFVVTIGLGRLVARRGTPS